MSPLFKAVLEFCTTKLLQFAYISVVRILLLTVNLSGTFDKNLYLFVF